MLDLHLFLGRPLKLARQSTQDEDADGILGAVPQALVDGEEASLRVSLETSHDLVSGNFSLTLSLLSSKRTFSQTFKEKTYDKTR